MVQLSWIFVSTSMRQDSTIRMVKIEFGALFPVLRAMINNTFWWKSLIIILFGCQENCFLKLLLIVCLWLYLTRTIVYPLFVNNGHFGGLWSLGFSSNTGEVFHVKIVCVCMWFWLILCFIELLPNRFTQSRRKLFPLFSDDLIISNQ